MNTPETPQDPQFKLEFKPRQAAKFLVTAYINLKVSSIAADKIADNSRFDSDDMIVKLGAASIGALTSAFAAPLTDAAIDATSDFANAKRRELTTKFKDRRAAKKAAKQENSEKK